MTKEEKTILKAMCNVIGVKFEEVDFKKEYWFHDHTWTAKQEQEFIEWLTEYYNKKGSKLMAGNAAQMFVLNYGWKTNDL